VACRLPSRRGVEAPFRDGRPWTRDFLARDVPTVRLFDAAFGSRHRALRVILWLHLPLIVTVAVLGGHAGIHFGQSEDGHAAMGHTRHAGPSHAGLLWLFIAGVATWAIVSGVVMSRRAQAVAASVGLLLAAAALPHSWPGGRRWESDSSGC